MPSLFSVCPELPSLMGRSEGPWVPRETELLLVLLLAPWQLVLHSVTSE